MSWYPLFTPGDGRYKQNYRTEEDRCEVQKPILAKWQGYIENGWMSENHEAMFCTENKIKWFLDGCADFILSGKGNSRNIMTAYKEKRNREKEISLEEYLERNLLI